MSDDSQKSGEPDRSRINVNQEHELRYWTQKLGITEERLRAVVREVGTMADKVRECSPPMTAAQTGSDTRGYRRRCP